jgi:hypothetical protein
LALSGDPGSSPNEFLSVSFASSISSVTITGDPAGGSFVMDDATLATADTESVPEPTTFSLIAACLFLKVCSLWPFHTTIARLQHRLDTR